MPQLTKKERHTNFVNEIYRLGLLDLIDINVWEQKKLQIMDGIWEWNVTKNIWETDKDKCDKDKFVELRITCSNDAWVWTQKFPTSIHNKIYCNRSCFVYKNVGYPYDKKNTIWKDNLVFQGISMKY